MDWARMHKMNDRPKIWEEMEYSKLGWESREVSPVVARPEDKLAPLVAKSIGSSSMDGKPRVV
jgi:hypothetical protein